MAASSEAEKGGGEVGGDRAGQVERLDLDPPPGVQGDLTEWAEEHHAGAVDQHVAPPETAGDLACEQRDAAGRTEVAFHRERLPTQGQDMPGLGEPQRDGLADPARRSCYDRDAPARLDHAACVTER